jgi:hypothetical protein
VSCVVAARATTTAVMPGSVGSSGLQHAGNQGPAHQQSAIQSMRQHMHLVTLKLSQ